MQRLRSLTEAECYARCYGDRLGVRVVDVEPRRPRHEVTLTGETLRMLFEERLDAREAEAA